MSNLSHEDDDDKGEISGGVQLPGGSRADAKLKGYRMGDFIMAVAFIFVFVVKPVWDEYRGIVPVNVAKMSQELTAQNEKLSVLTETVTSLVISQNETNYILTLEPDDRKELNLMMPDSLRDRTDWQRQQWNRREAKTTKPAAKPKE